MLNLESVLCILTAKDPALSQENSMYLNIQHSVGIKMNKNVLGDFLSNLISIHIDHYWSNYIEKVLIGCNACPEKLKLH